MEELQAIIFFFEKKNIKFIFGNSLKLDAIREETFHKFGQKSAALFL
jgi:hypothetical protein